MITSPISHPEIQRLLERSKEIKRYGKQLRTNFCLGFLKPIDYIKAYEERPLFLRLRNFVYFDRDYAGYRTAKKFLKMSKRIEKIIGIDDD